jgi:regulator of nucleoside diphosphate kinase
METVMSDINTLPTITLLPADRERLERLAYASMDRIPQTAEYLAREIERARVLDAGENAEDFVRMESAVTFRDDSTGQERRITLVYPDRADIAAGRVSVMTPLGAALSGLSKGQKIAWQAPAGDWRSLTVLAVEAPVAEEQEPA